MSATCLLETSPRGFPVDSQALGDCKALPTGHRKESGILDGHQVLLKYSIHNNKKSTTHLGHLWNEIEMTWC